MSISRELLIEIQKDYLARIGKLLRSYDDLFLSMHRYDPLNYGTQIQTNSEVSFPGYLRIRIDPKAFRIRKGKLIYSRKVQMVRLERKSKVEFLGIGTMSIGSGKILVSCRITWTDLGEEFTGLKSLPKGYEPVLESGTIEIGIQ